MLDMLMYCTPGRFPVKSFQWKDKYHNLHNPTEMETRHLFMTLVLIWNHRMPKDAWIRNSGGWQHHIYDLSSYYSDDYLKTAIHTLGHELSRRDDIHPDWMSTLNRMADYLRTHSSRSPELYSCTRSVTA